MLKEDLKLNKTYIRFYKGRYEGLIKITSATQCTVTYSNLPSIISMEILHIVNCDTRIINRFDKVLHPEWVKL